MDFEGKVVLLTGASSGIGAATAVHFAKLSAKLALVGLDEKNLRLIANYCSKFKGTQPLIFATNITIENEVERIVKETMEHFGKIDVLVNNAGIVALGGIKRTSLDKFDSVMKTNIRSVYHLTMLVVPELVKTEGNIVNVSSVESSKPYVPFLPYNLSKAALDQFTKCLALELAPDGVRVNSVNPGYVKKTNFLKDIGLDESALAHFIGNLINDMPLKQAIGTDEVAEIILYLASDKAKSVTGMLFPIDGGRHLY